MNLIELQPNNAFKAHKKRDHWMLMVPLGCRVISTIFRGRRFGLLSLDELKESSSDLF